MNNFQQLTGHMKRKEVQCKACNYTVPRDTEKRVYVQTCFEQDSTSDQISSGPGPHSSVHAVYVTGTFSSKLRKQMAE